MKINNITLKDSDTTAEKKLLGAIAEVAEQVGYGNITIDITISRGKIAKMSIIDSRKVVLLD